MPADTPPRSMMINGVRTASSTLSASSDLNVTNASTVGVTTSAETA